MKFIIEIVNEDAIDGIPAGFCPRAGQQTPCCGDASPCAFPFCSGYDHQASDCSDADDLAAMNIRPPTEFPKQKPLRSFTVYNKDGSVFARGTVFPNEKVAVAMLTDYPSVVTHDSFRNAYAVHVAIGGRVILFDN